VVSGVRDYLAWHEQYDDLGSSLSRRLALVREVLRAELDARPGPVRVVSLCAGDGRDILGVLAEREDAARVSVTLVEVLPELVERARSAAAVVAADVEVLAADAGCSETYVGLGTVPADVVLLVGVLGNISDADVAVTVAAMPRLCAPGATLLWSRGRSPEGSDDFVTPVREGILRRRVRRGVYPFIRRRGRPHGARRCSLRRTACAARAERDVVHLRGLSGPSAGCSESARGR
jgi:SAM-dependent methyltransferase